VSVRPAFTWKPWAKIASRENEIATVPPMYSAVQMDLRGYTTAVVCYVPRGKIAGVLRPFFIPLHREGFVRPMRHYLHSL